MKPGDSKDENGLKRLIRICLNLGVRVNKAFLLLTKCLQILLLPQLSAYQYRAYLVYILQVLGSESFQLLLAKSLQSYYYVENLLLLLSVGSCLPFLRAWNSHPIPKWPPRMPPCGPVNPEAGDPTNIGDAWVPVHIHVNPGLVGQWARQCTREYRPYPGEILCKKYKIEHAVGAGHFTRAYLATDIDSNTKVCIKRHGGLTVELMTDLLTISRRIESVDPECKIFSRLIEAFFDMVGYTVETLIEGRNCMEICRTNHQHFKDMSNLRTVAIGCLRGLELLCNAGVVHCDMKADNFMWTKGPDGATVVRIVDFGLANRGTGEPALPPAGEPVGEVSAPSQAAKTASEAKGQCLAVKVAPPVPPAHLEHPPVEKVKQEIHQGTEEEEDTAGVAASSSRRATSRSHRRHRERRDRERSHRRSRDRSRRSRRRSTSDRRGDKRTPNREEQRGREKKTRSEKPPEPDYPPPGASGHSSRPPEPACPPPGRGVRRPSADRPEDSQLVALKRPLASLTLQELQSLGPVYLPDARYYGRLVQVAGRLQGLQHEGGEIFTELLVSGVKDDELLRLLSGEAKRVLRVHLCSETCGGLLTDALLIHGKSFEEVDLARVPWLTNMEGVEVPPGPGPDELEALRELQRKSQELERDGGKTDEKKSKKRKKKQEGVEGEEGRKERPPKRGIEDDEIGRKKLEDVFGGTGLDPDPVQRGRILRKAKRLGKGKKKKKKESSSEGDSTGSSSTSTSSSAKRHGRGLFEDENKLNQLWKRYPGSLTAHAVHEARHRLMSQAGTLWNLSDNEIPPLFTQYARQQVLAHTSASPAIQQELLTISQALDFALMGKMASMADILCQRVKSLEATIEGSHWTFAREMELVRSDQFTMAEDSETLQAARRAREGDRLRNLLTRPQGSKGGGGDGKTRKGSGKPTAKGRPEEGGKGRGGDNRPKDDGRTGGRKT
eukprot:s1297_g6.t1